MMAVMHAAAIAHVLRIDRAIAIAVHPRQAPGLRGLVFLHTHAAVAVGVHAREPLGLALGLLRLAERLDLVRRYLAVMVGIDLGGAGGFEGLDLGLRDLAVMVGVHLLEHPAAPAAMAAIGPHGGTVGEAAGADEGGDAGRGND